MKQGNRRMFRLTSDPWVQEMGRESGNVQTCYRNRLGIRSTLNTHEGWLKGGATVVQPKGNSSSSSSSSSLLSARAPCGLDEAFSYGKTIDISESVVRAWYDRGLACGWVQGVGHGGVVPIGDWQASLRKWVEQEPQFSRGKRKPKKAEPFRLSDELPDLRD
jgi:hypothetical protein